MKQPGKRFIVVGSLVLLLIVLAVLRWGGFGNREQHVIRVSGNIELREVDIAFKSAGKLVRLAVDEGDTVQKGSLVAVLDQAEVSQRRDSAVAAVQSATSRLDQLRTAIAYQKEQVEGQLARSHAEVQQAEAVLQELLHGSRKQEIEAARAALARAETEYTRAERDWERAQTLYKDGDISTAQYDDFRARFESAKALRTQGKQQLDLIEEGPRKEDIEAARAQLERAKANLRLAEAVRLELKRMQQEQVSREADIQQAKAQLGVNETQLRDTEVLSPMDGVVLVKSAEPGEVLAAGTTVVTLGDVARPWLRAYINETDLGRVRLGAEVKVTTDSFPGKVYKGRLTFIASEAEFTPKQIQTQEERVKLVYRTKIEIENPNGELKSNMPADAEIPLAGNE
jgi:HlyD family secretion protein